MRFAANETIERGSKAISDFAPTHIAQLLINRIPKKRVAILDGHPS
jgi:hypothetical protein